MNSVEETLRVVNAQIGVYKKKISELEDYRKELMDKYDITMEEDL